MALVAQEAYQVAVAVSTAEILYLAQSPPLAAAVEARRDRTSVPMAAVAVVPGAPWLVHLARRDKVMEAVIHPALAVPVVVAALAGRLATIRCLSEELACNLRLQEQIFITQAAVEQTSTEAG